MGNCWLWSAIPDMGFYLPRFAVVWRFRLQQKIENR
jgi:hypothetical protein